MRNRNIVLLFLAAFIWGTAFVAQSVSLNYISPLTFNACRFFIGFLVLLPFVVRNTKKGEPYIDKHTFIIGISCSIVLFIAANLQQIGLQYSSVGKTGFLTGLYIIIVPFLNKLLFKENLSKNIFIGLLLATIGLYLLSITETFTIEVTDLILLTSALFFAFQILIIDHFAYQLDGVKVSCVQFFGVSILSMIAAILTEDISLSSIIDAYIPILYTGVLSCGIAYTLQIIGQKDVNPALASLILSLESTIATIAAFVILNEILTQRELIGCLFVFCSVIIAQLPNKVKEVN